MTSPIPEHRTEIFSNKFGTTKAVVCSCGFATTYTVLSNYADEISMEHFRRIHDATLTAAKQDVERALAPITIGEWGNAGKLQTHVNGLERANFILERRRGLLEAK